MDQPWMEGMQYKFLVIKVADVMDKLTQEQQNTLQATLDVIYTKKVENGENTENRYLVVNVDESYAEEVASVMKANGDWGSVE